MTLSGFPCCTTRILVFIFIYLHILLSHNIFYDILENHIIIEIIVDDLPLV